MKQFGPTGGVAAPCSGRSPPSAPWGARDQRLTSEVFVSKKTAMALVKGGVKGGAHRLIAVEGVQGGVCLS